MSRCQAPGHGRGLYVWPRVDTSGARHRTCPNGTVSADAVAELRAPVQPLRVPGQRALRRRDARALRGRAGGTDRDVPRIAAEAALELRIADVDEAADRRHALEVGDPLGLRVAVVHEPGLALERR